MKAITIRGVDSELSEKLKETARLQGKSTNRLILDMIKKSLDGKKKNNIPADTNIKPVAGTFINASSLKFRGHDTELHSKANNAEFMILTDRSFEGGKELMQVGFDLLVHARQLRTQRF